MAPTIRRTEQRQGARANAAPRAGTSTAREQQPTVSQRAVAYPSASSSASSSSTPWRAEPSSHPLSSPPPLVRGRGPYATIPLPPQNFTTSRHLGIHPLLDCTSGRVVRYDLAADPPMTMAMTHALSESATEPPLPSLTLFIPNFPWPIIVHGSRLTPSGSRIVCVWDVWWTLSRELRSVEVSQDVLRRGLMGSAVQGPSQVVASANGLTGAVLKRLDYLGPRTSFMGLSQSPEGYDTLIVHVR
ncbi:hypothetical protein ONZ45_g7442 [Pleurotus djamor]|nr:hypothetical protein ONZ45_g7442 [Pleurotus djamor]